MKRVAVGLSVGSIASAAYAADMSGARCAYTKGARRSARRSIGAASISAPWAGYAAEATSDPLQSRAGSPVARSLQLAVRHVRRRHRADGAWADINRPQPLASSPWRTRSRASAQCAPGRRCLDQVLFYGTGGFAFADNKSAPAHRREASSDSKGHTGWARARRGMDVRTCWSVKAEYLYRRFDSQTLLRSPAAARYRERLAAMNSGQVGINYHSDRVNAYSARARPRTLIRDGYRVLR